MTKPRSHVLAAFALALALPLSAHASSLLLKLAPAILATATPDASQSTFAGNLAGVVADNVSTVSFTAALNDSSGNPVVGQAVSISATGSNNTFSAASGVTDSSGVWVSTLRSSKAEAKVISLVAGAVTMNANANFRPGALNATTSSIVASPNTGLVADNNTQTTLTVTLRDGQRNPITNQNVTLAVTGTSNTIGTASGAPDANGVFTSTLKSSKSEVKRATATIGAITLNTNLTFLAGSPNATNTTFVVTPNATLTADGVAAATYTITAIDDFSNLAPGQNVTVSASGGNNTISAASGLTNSAGVFTGTLKSIRAETKVLTLGVAGVTQSANVVFVAGPPKVPNTKIVASPNTAVADANTTITLTGTVLDGTNNPINNQAVTLTISGGNNVLQDASGTTDANGTFATSFTSTKAESKTITLRAGTAAATTAVTVTPGSPNATYSTFAVSPNAGVVANNAAVATTTTTLRDIFSNLVPNTAVSLASTGTGNTFSAANGNTNASGVFVSTLKSTVAELKQVSVSGGLSASANVNFVPGPASTTLSSLIASPNAGIVADNNTTATLTAQLYDAQHNLLANQNVTVLVSGTLNTLGARTGTTDANGMFTTDVKSARAETKTITLTAGPTSLTTGITFVAGSPNTATTTLAAAPASVVANNTATTTLTATVRDAYSNVVPNQNTSLSVSGGNNTLASAGGNTSVAGVFTTTLKSSLAELKVVTLTAGNVTINSNVTFVPGPATTVNSLLVVDSNDSLVANNANAFTFTATMKDGQDNPVTNFPVTVSSSGTGNTFSKSSGNTDGNGTFVTVLRSTRAEAKNVSIKAGTASPNITVQFVAGSPNQKASSLVATPTTLLADGNAATRLVATIRDAFQNPIGNEVITLDAGGSNNTLAAANGNTAATGDFNTTLKSTFAEVKVITLTAGGFTINTNVTFSPGSPNGTTSTFAISPNALTANNNDLVTLTAAVADSLGNPIPKQAVTVKATGTANTFAASSGLTNASGGFSTTLKSTKAEQKTISFTAGSLTLNNNVVFGPGSPSATTSTIAATPLASVVADNNSTAQVTGIVLDAQRNPVPGTAVTLSSTNGNATFASAGGNVDANGLIQTTLTSSSAGVQRITLTAGSMVVNSNVTFVAGSPNGTNTTFVASPNVDLTANGTAASTLTAIVIDSFGNPVPNQAVSVASDGNGNSFGAASGKTDLTGKFTTTFKSTVAQAKRLTFTAGSVTQQANVTFVVGPPSGTTSTLVATPASVVANNSNTATLVATVKDATGNLIGSQAVTLASSGNNNVLGSASGSTDANGVFSTTIASSKSEVKTVTLTAGSATVKTTLTFTAGSPNATLSTFVISPNAAVVADNSALATLTARIADDFNNPVPSQAVTFSATGTQNTLASAGGNTSALGVFTTTLKSKIAELKTVTMTGGSVSIDQNVTFKAGLPSATTSPLVLSPNSDLVVDGNNSTTLSVTVRDAYNNIIANQNVSVISTGFDNAFAAASGQTDANGFFTTTLTSHKAETKTVTLTMGAAKSSATAVFSVGSPNSTTSTVVLTPLTAIADNTAAVSVTTTARDAYNNVMPNQAISLTADGGNTTLTNPNGTTTSAGVYVTQLKSNLASVKRVTATIGSASASGNATFIAGPASGNTSVFTIEPNSLTADNSNTSLVHVEFKDAAGNPVGNTLVTVSTSGVGATATPSSGSTNGAGEFNAVVKSTKAELKVVTFKVGSTLLNANVTFVAGSPNAKASTLVTSPANVVADGNAAMTLTVTVRDATNNAIASSPVTFASSNGNDTFASANGNTNASGVVSTTVKSTAAEMKVITITAGSVTLNANVTFVAGSPNASLSTFVISPNETLANNANTMALTATILDAYSNPVPNQAVALSANGTLNVFSAASGKTNATGVYTSTLKSSKAESKVVTMVAGAATLTGNVNFLVGPPSAVMSTLAYSPNTKVTADNNALITLKATLKDGTGNLLAGLPVTLASTGTDSTLASSGGNTEADGTFTTTLKTSRAEIKKITLTAGSMSINTNVTFWAGSPNAASTTFVISPNDNILANNAAQATLTAKVIDDFNNLVTGQAVTLNANGTGNAFTLASGTTNSTGGFISNMRSTTAETKAVTFSAGNVNITGAVTFIAGAPSAAKSTFILSPNSVVADGNTTMSVVAVLRDGYNNLIVNQNYTITVGGSNNTLSGDTGTTDANGALAASFQSTRAESKKVTLTVAGTVLTTTGVVSPGSPNLTLSSFVVSPNASVVADYSTASTVTGTLVDAFNNPLANQNVKLSSTDGSLLFTPANGNTVASGQFVAKVKSSTAGSKQLIFKSGGNTLNANITFVAGAPSSTASNLTASPRFGTSADGSAQVSLTGSVLDALDNPISGQATQLTSSIASDVFSPSTSSTDANGNISATMTATVGGTRTVTLKAGAATTTATVIFNSLVSSRGMGEGQQEFFGTATWVALDEAALAAREDVASATAKVRGDFDNDGAVDVALVSRRDETLTVLFNDGRGQVGETYVYAATGEPVAIASGDVDGDGFTDIVIANDADGTVALYHGIGNGAFDAPIKRMGIAHPRALALADFDGKGRADLAIVGREQNVVHVLENLGTSQFAFGEALLASAPARRVVARDLNADGVPDLAVAGQGGAVEVFFNDPQQGFAAPVAYPVGHATCALHAQGKASHDPANDGCIAALFGESADVGQVPSAQP